MTELTTHQANATPTDLTADEIAAVSGGSGLVGPGAGKEDGGGGGTIGSGT
ncbi:MAG TPA: hypothetical protein VGB79_02515 [Allosphingosinicella sp.]|jgi:hypothetical protein